MPLLEPSQNEAIRDLLAASLPDNERIRIIAFDSGIPIEKADFAGAPQVVWQRVLEEAQRQGRHCLEALLAHALKEAPALKDAPAFVDCRESLLASPPDMSQPHYWDERSKQASREYLEVLERKERLEASGIGGEALVGVRRELAEAKRRMREGGQLKPGDVLGERFLLLERIDAGGFAVVWSARDRQTGETVAVKVLKGDFACDRTHRDRFARGIREMAELAHAHVVRVVAPYDVDGGYRMDDGQIVGGFHFFAMELLEGGNFQRAVRQRRLSVADVRRIIDEVASALAHAHGMGRLHRDVKPANILLDAEGRAKLTDFDLVRVEDSTQGTRTGALGTAFYAAPEVFKSRSLEGPAGGDPAVRPPLDMDARADIYSLAMTAVFGFSNREPDIRLLRELETVVRGLPVPEAVQMLLLRSLHDDREARPANMEVFRQAFCAGFETAPGGNAGDEAVGDTFALWPWLARRLWLVTLSGVIVVLVGVALRNDWWGGPRAEDDDVTVALQPAPTPLHSPNTPLQLSPAPLQPTPMPIRSSPTPLRSIPPIVPTGSASVAISWITIPGGEFMMGSENGSDDEKPRHKVKVPSFQMSKAEVTVAQYRECVEAGHCQKPRDRSYNECCNWGDPDRDDDPVNCVTWNDAREFAAWKGGGGRLPTEAEWEFAARSGGKDISYPWGNDPATCERAVMSSGRDGCGQKSTWSICSKPKGNTAQGVCDMAGNLWEWVEDCYHNSYDEAPGDGRAWTSACEYYDGTPEKPDSPFRVLRGGSWDNTAGDVRSAYRNRAWSGFRYVNYGFRLVRPAPRRNP